MAVNQRPLLIAPSLLAADFLHLDQQIRKVNESQADWLHLDVMDGRFVPNISFGMPLIRQIKPLSAKPLDVHLMIVEPDRYVEAFHQAGADHLIVHLEACTHLHRVLEHIRSLGMKTGVAINPHSPVDLLKDVLYMTDLVCLMSVNPGFGGQSYIAHSFKKIRELRALIEACSATTLIEVDGGVHAGNAKAIYEAGADILVAGSSIFGQPAIAEAVCSLKNAAAAR